MQWVEGITELLKAIALVGFALAALYVALAIFDMRPDLKKLIRKFARTDTRGEIRRMIERALQEEHPPIVDVTPRKRKSMPRKGKAPAELPAPVEP